MKFRRICSCFIPAESDRREGSPSSRRTNNILPAKNVRQKAEGRKQKMERTVPMNIPAAVTCKNSVEPREDLPDQIWLN
jgi:hypothetical protein